MDFSAKRLALLAGVGSPEDRHDIVQEQVQQLNESIEARETNDSEEQVRKAVRRTIQKMIAEGNLSLEEAHHEDVEEVTGGSARVMEQEGDDEAADKAAAKKAARAAVEASPEMKSIKSTLAQLLKKPSEVIGTGGRKGTPELSSEEARKIVRNHPVVKALLDTLEDINEGEVTEEMDDDMSEGDLEEVQLYEMEDGSMHMEMGGVRYHLQELEEVEIPDGATDAVVGDGGKIEFSQKMDAAE